MSIVKACFLPVAVDNRSARNNDGVVGAAFEGETATGATVFKGEDGAALDSKDHLIFLFTTLMGMAKLN